MLKKPTIYILASVLVLIFAVIRILLNANIEEQFVEEEAGYDKPEGYYSFYQLISTTPGQQTSGYPYNYAYAELISALDRKKSLKAAGEKYNWVQRGPGNVGGRTRQVVIDPGDPAGATWYAAAVSGGIWKTTNSGQSWQELTDHLPNLATNCLAMAPSNGNILYAGTGEGYGGFGMVNGNGIIKSTDRGVTWSVLTSTLDTSNSNFRWVNRIAVHPNDANTLLAATNSGVFKSADGGATWDTSWYKGYRVQDLAVNPLDGNTVYAAVNRLGIIRSYDFGDTWTDSYAGIGTGYRFAVSVSPADTGTVFTSVEAPGQQTHVYISTDAGMNWRKLNDYDFSFIHFLGSQGWFNNVITAHPFDASEAFIGGVYLGKVDFRQGIRISEPQVMRVDTFGTASFMAFINFGGGYLDGAMATGLEEDADVEEEDFSSVEIRFGPGISQKAHRFTVPEGEGPGVPREDYNYEDYIEVPFQVWDTETNTQLMASFRDQERDGEFNLIERRYDEEIDGREYIFAHAIPYAESPDNDVAVNGGHFHAMTYFLWPTLAEDAIWDAGNLPQAKIRIQYGTFNLQDAATTVLADDNRNADLHVDHHDIQVWITDEAEERFTLVNANDGGLGISEDEGLTWRQLKNNYPTTQFYGVAKKPGSQQFIGGMQDNGTWQSTPGEEAGASTEYLDRVAGDGFEALWHPEFPHRILASTYYNGIRLSNDGGETWSSVTEGIAGDGPFITRLSHSPENPDLVFAVGDRGVYRHTNFCVGRYPWTLTRLDDTWAVNDEVTSAHNVEVSLADPSIVWAGGGMFRDPDLNIFVSTDYGRSFDTVSLYDERDEMGFITGIATHPTEPETAYLLFSLDHKPKILRTTDLGASWEDISGFGADSTSSNGFPDVHVYSLLVFPYDTDKIWAGTEIGIFESADNGETWYYADNGLPAVSVWQLFIQDHSIVAATHGRGIWSAPEFPGSIPNDEQLAVGLDVYPNPAISNLNYRITSEAFGEVSVTVWDMKGQAVLQQKKMKADNDFSGRLDVSSLSSGTYILSVVCEGESGSIQFIVR